MPTKLSDIELLIRMNYRLTTAEIIYHMPDHYHLLQSYIWQELDLAPHFPVLKKFLGFWETSLEGKLHSVKVGSCDILSPAELVYVKNCVYLH